MNEAFTMETINVVVCRVRAPVTDISSVTPSDQPEQRIKSWIHFQKLRDK